MSCKEKNKLHTEGTSHLNRVLDALSSAYARPDERDTADILIFARRYASYLNYYNSNDEIDGDWEPLMMMDISVTLATLVKTDINAIVDYKKLLYKKIHIAESEEKVKLRFRFLFDLIFSLVKSTDDQYKLIPADLEFKILFKNTIELKMKEALWKIHSLFVHFKNIGWINLASTELDSDAPIPIKKAIAFTNNELSVEWGIPSSDLIITPPSFPDVKDNIIHVINHNLFNAQIEIIWKGITEIVTQASKLFEKTLTDFPSHTPHYALFLSFIKLFRYAQDHLNNYPQRHLDFYYKDILQLINKAPESDSAHILFELQKPITMHQVKKEVLFKGGKDSTGKEITYALTDDIIVNKATVTSIQSQQVIPASGRLIASPLANSEDGQGAEIKTLDKSWFTFGDVNKVKFAKTGFAIASNLLFLKEGERKIKITVRFQNKIAKLKVNSDPIKCFSARLTGDKAWHEIAQTDLYMSSSLPMAVDTFTFTLTLTADHPSIVPYTEKVHKENFLEGLPVIQFLLKQDAPDAIPYSLLCDKKIKSVSISVNVYGVKDLVLSNDMGTIDASKPFKPFGDFPAEHASFYIGSREIFQKSLDWIKLNPVWEIKNTVDEVIPVLTSAKYLHQANWDTNLPINSGNIMSFITPTSFRKTAVNFESTETLKANSLDGFLRLQLDSDKYSLVSHMLKIQKQLQSVKLKLDTDSQLLSLKTDPPPVPAEIFLNAFSIDYSATATIVFGADDEQNNNLFYHLTPFGYLQVHPSLVNKEINAEPVEKITLLQHLIHEGEIFIGFSQAAPSLVLNVLFQVADGSSNPLKNMEPLFWYYLSQNNIWKVFEKQFVIDRTKNFTQSGIVTFTLPDDISNDTTAFQEGLHWIKAAVKQNCDAVCKMISLHAQAAQVKLVQDVIKQIEFRETRPASSITKFVTGDAAIKSITQPFDSFSGRARESDEHFYLRVSERLRHKQRAISIWDYEHIILENFPQIFKVKCLNHSGFYFKGSEEVFCENYPGHVTLITIPDQKNKTHVNPLRPYTPIGLLQNINDYLITITTPFAKLYVKNPAFEEIQLDFEVKFYDNFDESFYLKLLNDEIERFLCPWAYDTQVEISFGGKIRKSAILNFVEERPYVDYVTCFKMNQVISRNGSVHTNVKSDIEIAEGSTSRSLLVSYYDEKSGVKHHIQSPATCDC